MTILILLGVEDLRCERRGQKLVHLRLLRLKLFWDFLLRSAAVARARVRVRRRARTRSIFKRVQIGGRRDYRLLRSTLFRQVLLAGRREDGT